MNRQTEHVRCSVFPYFHVAISRQVLGKFLGSLSIGNSCEGLAFGCLMGEDIGRFLPPLDAQPGKKLA